MPPSTTLKFEIVLIAPMGETYSDVQYMYTIKAPIWKSASFHILNINLTPLLIQQITNDIGNNLFPEFQLMIFLIDERNTDQQVRLIYHKPVNVVSLTLPTMTWDDQHIVIPAKLILTSTVLREMARRNSFNKILENKTALQAIQEFESFVENTYGRTVEFIYVGRRTKVNSFPHKQIVIPATVCDLNVIKYIINTFKPFHSYTFHFFDDLHISNNSTKPITCYIINLYDFSQFPTFNIRNSADIMDSTRRHGRSPFNDVFSHIDKRSTSVTFINNEFNFQTSKIFSSQVGQLSPDTTTTETLTEERSITISPARSQETSISQSSQSNVIYVPDSFEMAEERINSAKDMVTNIEGIRYFETRGCMIDWLHFGKTYNMESDNPDTTAYKYTPLTIINMFTRESEKGNFLHHSLYYSMIKIQDPE